MHIVFILSGLKNTYFFGGSYAFILHFNFLYYYFQIVNLFLRKISVWHKYLKKMYTTDICKKKMQYLKNLSKLFF